ncbi:hypothetical protein [Mycobacterium sp. 29Ha]|uniref:hypothetical protein n=1 Tax=Mycobacterium sp. 29Ha TaxID=2939268 RepID=UPI0039777210
MQAQGGQTIAEALDSEAAFRAGQVAMTASRLWTDLAAVAYDSAVDPRQRARDAALTAARLPEAEDQLMRALRDAADELR